MVASATSIGALAEFERSLIVKRTRAGLKAGKRRGMKLGRKPVLTAAQVAHARRLIDDGESPRTVASILRVGRTTLWRALKAATWRFTLGFMAATAQAHRIAAATP